MNRSQKQEEIECLGATIGQLAHAFLVDFTGSVWRTQRICVLSFVRMTASCGSSRIASQNAPSRIRHWARLSRLSLGRQRSSIRTVRTRLRSPKSCVTSTRSTTSAVSRSGLVDGQLITPEEFQSFADLPSRNELVAKVVYLMQYPITGLATALNSILRNFVVVLDAVRQQQENE